MINPCMKNENDSREKGVNLCLRHLKSIKCEL